MPESPFRVPELAGLGSYREAARVGPSVDETVDLLVRCQWLERAVMRTMLSHLTSTPEWEVKGGLALHQWLAGLHVDALRKRVSEMRHPVPPLDDPPTEPLRTYADELLWAGDTMELLTGLYEVSIEELARAYRGHLERSNLLVDHPTRRILISIVSDWEEALDWAGRASKALGAVSGKADPGPWREHLRAYLEAAGGVTGSSMPGSAVPPPRATGPFTPNWYPARDDRFEGTHQFDFPPHVVYNDPRASAAERNLALLCKRTLEMDVPEMMASVMIERTDMPWEFQLDFSRQLWDEMRHSMMGSAALEARGVDWTKIPLNIGFALRLNLHATPLERQILLYAIEQSLMPGDTGKRMEYRIAVEAGDQLSAHFHDFDWADEVLHSQIGRRWLRHDGISSEQARQEAEAIHQRTWGVLDRYREPDGDRDRDWWNGLVERTLGFPSAIPPDQRTDLNILAE